MANLRKEQEKLAVLLEISDTAKKNADIVKGAESRMIITEELARVLSDKKTTVLKKELYAVNAEAHLMDVQERQTRLILFMCPTDAVNEIAT